MKPNEELQEGLTVCLSYYVVA